MSTKKVRGALCIPAAAHALSPTRYQGRYFTRVLAQQVFQYLKESNHFGWGTGTSPGVMPPRACSWAAKIYISLMCRKAFFSIIISLAYCFCFLFSSIGNSFIPWYSISAYLLNYRTFLEYNISWDNHLSLLECQCSIGIALVLSYFVAYRPLWVLFLSCLKINTTGGVLFAWNKIKKALVLLTADHK